MSDNANSTWQCACGHVNTGRFCAECGKEKSAYAQAPAPAAKPAFQTYQSKAYTRVGVITGVMILLANSFVCALTLMALMVLPFALMLGAWKEDLTVGMIVIAVLSSIVEYLGIAEIIMTCFSRNKKGKYTAKKVRSQRRATIILAAIGVLGSIPGIVWMSESLVEFNVCYFFAGAGLILVPVMIVLAVKDAKKAQA